MKIYQEIEINLKNKNLSNILDPLKEKGPETSAEITERFYVCAIETLTFHTCHLRLYFRIKVPLSHPTEDTNADRFKTMSTSINEKDMRLLNEHLTKYLNELDEMRRLRNAKTGI